MAWKRTLPENIFKTPLPGQIQTSSWRQDIMFTTVHITDDDISFVTAPECLYVKPQNRAWIARELPG